MGHGLKPGIEPRLGPRPRSGRRWRRGRTERIKGSLASSISPLGPGWASPPIARDIGGRGSPPCGRVVVLRVLLLPSRASVRGHFAAEVTGRGADALCVLHSVRRFVASAAPRCPRSPGGGRVVLMSSRVRCPRRRRCFLSLSTESDRTRDCPQGAFRGTCAFGLRVHSDTLGVLSVFPHPPGYGSVARARSRGFGRVPMCLLVFRRHVAIGRVVSSRVSCATDSDCNMHQGGKNDEHGIV